MNKKALSIIVLVIIVLLGIWSFSKGKSSEEKQTIKIGVVAPLTGGGATYGEGLVKGMELAKKDLKNTKYNYELVIEDDATLPAQSASAAQKLVNIDKVQALVSVTGGTGNSVKAIAVSGHVPHISVSADTRIADGTYNFMNTLLPEEEAALWLKEAKANGAKTVAILAQNQAGFNLLTENVKKQAQAAGITLVYDAHFEPTVKDFKTDIAKARLTKPDLFLVGFFPPQLDIIGQQLKDLKIENFAGMATIPIGAKPEIFNGIWYTDASLGDKAFQERFEKEYPNFRFNVRVAPPGYDSFNLLVNAFESGQQVPAYLLSQTSYAGKGGNLVKEKGQAIFHSPIGIWEIQEGKAVQLK